MSRSLLTPGLHLSKLKSNPTLLLANLGIFTVFPLEGDHAQVGDPCRQL